MEGEMNVSDLEERKSATVHGVFVGGVSPIKKSRNKADVQYFESNFSDGDRTVRLVSFEPRLRKAVEDAYKTKREVAVTNCCVKRNRGDAFEILANNKSSITNSPKKFKVDDEVHKHAAGAPGISDLGTIEELKDLQEMQWVNVTGKVQSISPPEEIKGKGCTALLKQDFMFADGTGVCRGVVWQQQVDMLREEHSYKLLNVTIRSFNGGKYISLGERSEIQEIEDVGYVVDESVFNETGQLKVFNAEIVAVINSETYISCKNCNAKVLESSGNIAVCGKCSTKMKLSKCGKKSVTRVILEDEKENEHKVTIFSDILHQIVEYAKPLTNSVDLVEQLLLAPKLSYTINAKETVASVSRMI